MKGPGPSWAHLDGIPPDFLGAFEWLQTPPTKAKWWLTESVCVCVCSEGAWKHRSVTWYLSKTRHGHISARDIFIKN